MQPKTILFIEDDPLLIDIYTTKFQKAGFKMAVCTNGDESLERIKEAKPDLLLLDIVLPQPDGWEILKKVKDDPELKDLKVVILSNLGQKAEVEKGLALGATKYLIKAHYTPSKVVEEVKNIFGT